MLIECNKVTSPTKTQNPIEIDLRWDLNYLVNYTIKCNSREKKRSSYKSVVK